MDILRRSLVNDLLVTVDTDGTVDGYKTWNVHKHPNGSYTLVYIQLDGDEIQYIVQDNETMVDFFSDERIIEILDGRNVLYQV